MGTCNGVLSSCALGGYAMETRYVSCLTFQEISLSLSFARCHLGETIVYDTVGNLSWSVDIRTHGIVAVIEQVLAKPWPPSENLGREVPTPKYQVDCLVSSPVYLYDSPLLDILSGMFQLGIWGFSAQAYEAEKHLATGRDLTLGNYVRVEVYTSILYP